MTAPGERLNRSPETNQQVFDWLLDKITPLSNHSLLYKLSAKTSGLEHDAIGSKYELPPLVISSDRLRAVKLTVLQEESVDFSRGRELFATNRKLSIDWRPTDNSTEGSILEKPEDIYSADDLSEIIQARLLEIIEQYETAARELSPEEAKAKGFSDEAITFLGLN